MYPPLQCGTGLPWSPVFHLPAPLSLPKPKQALVITGLVKPSRSAYHVPRTFGDHRFIQSRNNVRGSYRPNPSFTGEDTAQRVCDLPEVTQLAKDRNETDHLAPIPLSSHPCCRGRGGHAFGCGPGSEGGEGRERGHRHCPVLAAQSERGQVKDVLCSCGFTRQIADDNAFHPSAAFSMTWTRCRHVSKPAAICRALATPWTLSKPLDLHDAMGSSRSPKKEAVASPLWEGPGTGYGMLWRCAKSEQLVDGRLEFVPGGVGPARTLLCLDRSAQK